MPGAKVMLTKADIKPAPVFVEKVWPMPTPAPAQTTEPNMVEEAVIEKANLAVLDVLVRKRLENHPDELEAVAMSKVLETKAGKQCYAKMAHAHDVVIAKATTLRTWGNRGATQNDDAQNAGPDRETAVDAWSKLDRMAKDHAAANSVPFHHAYTAVLGTPKGKALYRQGCAMPSGAGGAA